MKALVVGYGSIGMRHARLLEHLGLDVAVASRRAVAVSNRFGSIEEALADWAPRYVVVASRTHEHFADVETLATAGFTGTVLVEKPLSDGVRTMPAIPFEDIHIGYNLRFLPVVQAFRDAVRNGNVYAVHAHVGQHLSQWRPHSDYRAGYSASRAQGGGVLRDLSHDLDYLSWILGGWNRVTAVGGKVSDLEIDSDDVFSVLMETCRCPVVSVNMNYLGSPPRREIVAFSDRGTVEVNLLAGTIHIDGKEEKTRPAARDDSYLSMHEAVLRGDGSVLCSLEEGLDITRLIDAAETAAARHVWVSR